MKNKSINIKVFVLSVIVRVKFCCACMFAYC